MTAARTALVSRRTLIDGELVPATVVIRGSLIERVLKGQQPASADDVIDVGHRILSPGLIDLHIHGAAGRSFEEADGEAAPAVLRHLAEVGVTAVQASLASAPVDAMVVRARSLHRRRDEPVPGGAALLGVHLEGPYLAESQCGAHDPTLLRTPEDRHELEELADLAPSMVTLAPELPGALTAIRTLVGAGTVVAAGHSEATGPALRAAIEAGLTHITHLWSGQSATQRDGPWRVPGLLEESLVADGVTAEVIADGKHLPPALLEIARRCLGERLVMVSDATAGAGMPDGYRYPLSAVHCVVHDGVGMVEGADSFGGSTTTLPGMLRHLHRDLGWALPEVLAMGTSRPARVIGADARKGRIASGMDADLVVLDDDLVARTVLVRGELIRLP